MPFLFLPQKSRQKLEKKEKEGKDFSKKLEHIAIFTSSRNVMSEKCLLQEVNFAELCFRQKGLKRYKGRTYIKVVTFSLQPREQSNIFLTNNFVVIAL